MATSKTSTTVAEQANRLDRIESKIDKLSETVVSMARVEEKILALENDKKVLMEKIIAFDKYLRNVEKKTDETASSLSVITRIFWIAITTIITSVIAMYFTK